MSPDHMGCVVDGFSAGWSDECFEDNQAPTSFSLTPQFKTWYLSTPSLCLITWKCHQKETP